MDLRCVIHEPIGRDADKPVGAVVDGTGLAFGLDAKVLPPAAAAGATAHVRSIQHSVFGGVFMHTAVDLMHHFAAVMVAGEANLFCMVRIKRARAVSRPADNVADAPAVFTKYAVLDFDNRQICFVRHTPVRSGPGTRRTDQPPVPCLIGRIAAVVCGDKNETAIKPSCAVCACVNENGPETFLLTLDDYPDLSVSVIINDTSQSAVIISEAGADASANVIFIGNTGIQLFDSQGVRITSNNINFTAAQINTKLGSI